MYSIGILSTVLFALLATTNALNCKPVTCMIACPYGFETNAEGCPHCSCRRTAPVCVEPIAGYNCGSMDHRDCPATYECQLIVHGLVGRCCLKQASSTTPRPVTDTTTARATGTSTHRAMGRMLLGSGFPTPSSTHRPHSTTGRPHSTSRHPMRRMLFGNGFSTQSTTRRPTTSRRPMNRMFMFAKESSSTPVVPVSTTQSGQQASTTGSFFSFDFSNWMGPVGK